MSLITPRSNTQYSGLTGRKINPPLNQILASQMPAATQILAAEARRRQEEERLIQEQKLKQEAIAMQEQQARTAALIRGGTTGIQLAKLIKDPEFMPQLTGKATELITQAAGLNELNKIALPLVLDPAAEGTKTIGATVAPIAAAQEAGKTALEEGGKIAAQEAGKTAATTGIGTTLKSIATSIAPYMTYHALRRGGQALLGYGLQELGGSENNVISQFGRTVSNTSNIEDIPFEWAKELDVVSAKNIRPFEWALNPAGKVLDFIDNPSNFFKDSCMIVTACTSRKSPEVEIAREYRDKFLTRRQLRGYYMLAEKIVPRMHRSPRLTRLIKRWLVDPLIVYGRHALVKTAPPPWRYERIIATAFLALIGCIGRTRKQFTRANGEVY